MSPAGMVVMGVSAGGLRALRLLVADLPEGFPWPVAVVQHRAPESEMLERLLQERTRLRVCEVDDKQPIEAATIYLAPADYHLLVDGGHFALSKDAPVAFSRPSIDVLFHSAADALAPRLIGVILTGANRDGADGLARIAGRGGHAVIQDPETAEVATMPRAALEVVPRATVLPLDGIAAHLTEVVRASTGGVEAS